jgi:toxin CptA
MHNAPSVSYPVGRCAFQRVTWLTLSVITAAEMFVWFMLQPVSWPMCLSGVATLLGVVLGWRSLSTQTGTLSWDGQVWCWHSRGRGADDALGEIFVSLDVQKALVLKWQPTSGRLDTLGCYLWLDQESATQRWLNLRCAVYGRAALR